MLDYQTVSIYEAQWCILDSRAWLVGSLSRMLLLLKSDS